MSQDVDHHPAPDDLGVVAVIVCYQGADFLPRTLQALQALDPAPTAVVAVDTGSTDATATIVSDSSVVDTTVSAPAGTGFAAAVHLGVDGAPASRWVWVLHDDCAPEPDALGVLLTHAEDQPSVAVWGPKILGWDEPRRLLEVGVSISRSGRRYTGLERREQDQGQYEGQRDVLAVGSAGSLIARDVWSDLGGYDRTLRFFREDVDFGWRVNLAGHRVVVATDAAVHHAEALARGRRKNSLSNPQAVDRVSALYTLLVNARRPTFLLRWLWLLFQTSLRGLAFVLGKAPHEAAAEFNAIGAVLLRPRRVMRGRRARRRWRNVPQRSLSGLFPPARQQIRHSLDAVAGALALEPAASGPSTVLESGPVEEDLDSFASVGTGRIRRLLARPGFVLFATLLVVQLVAWRGLYRNGVLHGGALLPVQRGATDVWDAYSAAWHPVMLGSPTMSSPAMAVLGVVATLLLGKATWVVPTVMVVGPPLAGLLTYQTTRSFGLSARLRLWLGVAYAVNPVFIAAIAQGRWTTVLVGVLAPVATVAVARATGLGGREPSSRAMAVAALLVAAMIGLSPQLVVPIALLLVGLAIWRRSLRARLYAVAIVLLSTLVWLPWWGVVTSRPSQLLLEPGLPLTSDSEAPWHALFFDPGGWWSLPWWVGVGVATAVVASVVRASRSAPVFVALIVTSIAVGWALVLESISVTDPTSGQPVAPWSGSVLVLGVGAAIIGAVTAARGSRSRLQRATFNWRQPAVAVVTLLAVVSPVLWAFGWLGHGASDPLDRGVANPLPAFVRAQSTLPTQLRTLVLQSQGGRLAYTVLRSRDAQLGDTQTAPSAGDMQGMDTVVADLASGRGSAPVDQLSERAVQFVLAVPPLDTDLESALDSAPGLLRISNPGGSALWRLEQPTGRIQIHHDDSSDVLNNFDDASSVNANIKVPSGDKGRILELAEIADDAWSATTSSPNQSSESLPADSSSSWSELFTVGSSAADVSIVATNDARRVELWVQLGLVIVLVVLALPGRSREDEDAV